MSRLNAFFQLIDEGDSSHKKDFIKEEKDHKKHIIPKLDAQEQKRLSLIQQKFNGFLKINEARDQSDNDDSSNNSLSDYPDDDEYNAFNLEDEGIQAIMRALSKAKKSNFEIKILTHALMHNPFFRKMRRQITETLYEDLFKEIQLETFNSLDTIFEFGEMGDKFYIILQGEVFILSPSQLGIALQNLEREKQQQALQKLKEDANNNERSPTDNLNLNINTNFNRQQTQRNSNVNREGSINNSPRNSFLKEDSILTSPKKQQSSSSPRRNYPNNLLKYAINNHHQTNNKMNDSFTSALSIDSSSQNQTDQVVGNQSTKNRFGDNFQLDKSSLSNHENNVSLSSPRSSLSSTSRNRENSITQDNQRQKIKKVNLEQQVYNKYPNFHIVKKLGIGDNFGEIALRMDKERTATVVCKTNCQFAVISKSAFQRILGGFFKQQMEEKEQFLSKIDLFKGYNFSFLANILMNIKKRIYNFNDVIYEEGSEKQKFYFIKSGEVELSKKVVQQNQSEIKYEGGANEFKKIDRVVMAQKYENEWFGEVEIMQKIPRFTRARCVSTKLEVFYISAIKFFANLNLEEIITDLKKNSVMIDSWRQNHYESMVNQIQNSKRDPLRKTFSNLQVAHDLINQKFKSEFLKNKPQTIIQPNKVEQTSIAAKIVYYNTVKNYVGKISDVIGTITKMKKNEEEQKKQEIDDKFSQLRLQKKNQYQSRSQSLPRFQNNQINISNVQTQIQYKNNSNIQSEMSSPIKLPQIQLNNHIDNYYKLQKEITPQLKQTLNQSQRGIVQSQVTSCTTVSSPLKKPSQQTIINNLSQQSIQINEKDKSLNTNNNDSQLASHQKIKLNIRKKISFYQDSQQELEDKSYRNSTRNIPQTSSSSLSFIQTQNQKSTERIQTNAEFLENLYDEIVSLKKNKSPHIFNSDINQKMIEEGLKKKNLQMHQPKLRQEDFSNILNKFTDQVGCSSVSKESAEKLKLFRKLKLDNILNYKYNNRLNKTELDNKQLDEKNNQITIKECSLDRMIQPKEYINSSVLQKIEEKQENKQQLQQQQQQQQQQSKDKLKKGQQLLQGQQFKFQLEELAKSKKGQILSNYQIPNIRTNIQNRLIQQKHQNSHILATSAIQSPLTKNLLKQKINQNMAHSHFQIN